MWSSRPPTRGAGTTSRCTRRWPARWAVPSSRRRPSWSAPFRSSDGREWRSRRRRRCGDGRHLSSLRSTERHERQVRPVRCRRLGVRHRAREDAPPAHAAAPAARDATLSTRRKLSFHGNGGTLFGIYVVNVLLTIVTLGIYRFWGRVKVRRFMMSQTSFEGDRLAYHGTGKELLNGFFRAGLIFGVPLTVLITLDELAGDRMVHVGIRFLSSVLIFIFFPVAMVGARRYRLSRTSWRGIRFAFRGRARDFISIFVRGSLLSSLTLSLYYPFFQARQQRFMIS